MKQQEIHNIYYALERLFGLDLPARKAQELFLLMDKIKPHHEFGITEERKIVEYCHGSVIATGEIQFSGDNPQECAKNCSEKLNALHNLDVDIEIQPIVLSINDLGEQRIKPQDLYALKGVVNIEG